MVGEMVIARPQPVLVIVVVVPRSQPTTGDKPTDIEKPLLDRLLEGLEVARHVHRLHLLLVLVLQPRHLLRDPVLVHLLLRHLLGFWVQELSRSVSRRRNHAIESPPTGPGKTIEK